MGGRSEWRASQGGRVGTNRKIDEKFKKREEASNPVTVIKKGKVKKKRVAKEKVAKPNVTLDSDGKPTNNFSYKTKYQQKLMSPEEKISYNESRIKAEKEYEDATMKFLFGD